MWNSTLSSEASVFTNTLDSTLYTIVLGQFLDRVALEEVMATPVDTPRWWLVFDCAPYMPLKYWSLRIYLFIRVRNAPVDEKGRRTERERRLYP